MFFGSLWDFEGRHACYLCPYPYQRREKKHSNRHVLAKWCQCYSVWHVFASVSKGQWRGASAYGDARHSHSVLTIWRLVECGSEAYFSASCCLSGWCEWRSLATRPSVCVCVYRTCWDPSPLTMGGIRATSPLSRGGGRSSGIWSVIIIVTYIHGEISWTALLREKKPKQKQNKNKQSPNSSNKTLTSNLTKTNLTSTSTVQWTS